MGQNKNVSYLLVLGGDLWHGILSGKTYLEVKTGESIRLKISYVFAQNFYNASDRKAIKILEVGCGPGANLWFMAREGFSVYGIDGSEHAIELARRRLDSE